MHKAADRTESQAQINVCRDLCYLYCKNVQGNAAQGGKLNYTETSLLEIWGQYSFLCSGVQSNAKKLHSAITGILKNVVTLAGGGTEDNLFSKESVHP